MTSHFDKSFSAYANNVGASRSCCIFFCNKDAHEWLPFHAWLMCGCSSVSSISNGTSGWERGEGSAQSQALHHHPEGGPRVHARRGESSSCRMLKERSPELLLHDDLTLFTIFSVPRKWRPFLRTTTVRKLSAWSLRTTITGTLHSNRTPMPNRWVR